MRQFFLEKNFIEVPTQSRLSILAACENPHSVKTFEYNGEIWPLPQTGQMWLEYELLKNPEWEGVFCISTSYREEKNPIPGRHEMIFPMFEFEMPGDIDDLKTMEYQLCNHLGFDIPTENWFHKGMDRISFYKFNLSNKRGHFVVLPSIFQSEFYSLKTIKSLLKLIIYNKFQLIFKLFILSKG